MNTIRSNRFLIIIPSAISSVRIAIGIVFPWLPSEWRMVAVALAACTDLIDGPISRWLKADGMVGKVIDPIADKIFLGSVLATVLLEGTLAWWEALLAGARDLVVLLACLVVFLRNGWSSWTRMQARPLGKATTVLQIALVVALVLGFPTLVRVLLVLTALVGGLALVDYFIAFHQQSTDYPPSPLGREVEP